MEKEAPTPIFLEPLEEELIDKKEYTINFNKQEFKVLLGKINNLQKITFKLEESNSFNK